MTQVARTSRKRVAGKKAEKNEALLFRFRNQDTAYGVTRRTAHALASRMGMSETQVLHVALAKMAHDHLPAYEPDNGPLSDKQIAAIKKMVPQGKMKVTKSLL
jgi:hypothetical protein